MDPFEGYGPDNPLIMSAAGLCKSFRLDHIEPLAAAADCVVVGSITLDRRDGNDGRCEYLEDPLYSVNAWGMPNPGSDGWPRLALGSQESDRYLALKRQGTLMVSLAEFTPLGYSALFERLRHWGSGVELNFGCPNVRDQGRLKQLVSFDPPVMARVLDLIEAAKRADGPRTFTGVKLSPYSDPYLLADVAAVVAESQTVDYVAVTNTFAGGRAYTRERKRALWTTQTGVVGGIGGEALKPISLANAAMFRELLPSRVAVVRVGGVSSGEDVWQSYDVGCTGVQVATAVMRHGPRVLDRMRQEYADIVG
jgi:dihydroorotate dehydrogenase